MRDDFSQRIKETLAKRVGYRCSNPRCRKTTSGPHSTSDKSVNVGVAAHITAASMGGPRYDSSVDADHRASVNNGLWLCQTCAKLIDSDPAKYTTTVLNDWKETAEHLASTEIHHTSVPVDASFATHSIQFAVDDWKIWRNRGNLPNDSVVILDGWARGDVRYCCRIRLRNDLAQDDLLHHPLMEFQSGDEVIHSDEYAFDQEDIVLPARRWITLDVSHGLHDFDVFEKSKTVWFRAETVGDNEVHRWQVATIEHEGVKLPEW